MKRIGAILVTGWMIMSAAGCCCHHGCGLFSGGCGGGAGACGGGCNSGLGGSYGAGYAPQQPAYVPQGSYIQGGTQAAYIPGPATTAAVPLESLSTY